MAPCLALGLRLLEERTVLAVPFLFELGDRDEAKRRRVDAIAEAGGAGTVGEQVTQVRVAARGAHLDPSHTVGVVGVLGHVCRHDRLDEARPPGAGVELVGGGEQRLTRHYVHVDARLVVVPELVPERRLGGAALSDVVLFRSQSVLELGIGRALCRGHGTSEYTPARQGMSALRVKFRSGAGRRAGRGLPGYPAGDRARAPR